MGQTRVCPHLVDVHLEAEPPAEPCLGQLHCGRPEGLRATEMRSPFSEQ